jgi:hypothetical protein
VEAILYVTIRAAIFSTFLTIFNFYKHAKLQKKALWVNFLLICSNKNPLKKQKSDNSDYGVIKSSFDKRKLSPN